MTNEEWNNIKNSHTSAIKAPAGHGKTDYPVRFVIQEEIELEHEYN